MVTSIELTPSPPNGEEYKSKRRPVKSDYISQHKFGRNSHEIQLHLDFTSERSALGLRQAPAHEQHIPDHRRNLQRTRLSPAGADGAGPHHSSDRLSSANSRPRSLGG